MYNKNNIICCNKYNSYATLFLERGVTMIKIKVILRDEHNKLKGCETLMFVDLKGVKSHIEYLHGVIPTSYNLVWHIDSFGEMEATSEQ